MKNDILLVGTGPMACAYATVLLSMNLEFTCVGRGSNSALSFEKETGVKPVEGGLEKYLENLSTFPHYAILATNTDNLMENLLRLSNVGIENILVEKPGALSIDELLLNEKMLQNRKVNIFLAYNRRFYSSVLEAQKLIEDDGGLQSIMFEFTEWAHIIEPLQKAPGIKENWFFANSTHVVDLAFHFAGLPVDWKSYTLSGQLKWHEKVNFVGAGITDRNVLFSYLSNWESAGRWGIELLTKNRRIYLKPLEKLSVQKKGSIKIEEHTFDDTLDQQYKPGLYRQVESFLSNKEGLLKMTSHFEISKNVYRKILG